MAYHPILKELEFQQETNSHIGVEVLQGTNLAGADKFGRATKVPNKDIIHVTPASGNNGMYISGDNEVRIGANYGSGTAKYIGACAGADGKIYDIPYRSSVIAVTDYSSDKPVTSYTRYGLGMSVDGYYWSGGALGSDGKIYCSPMMSTLILTIDTINQTAIYQNFGLSLPANSRQYIDAQVGADGKIYFIPYHSTNILVIDVENQTASLETFGLDLSGSAKFGGACVHDGIIYASPNSSTTALVIDTNNGTAIRSDLGSTNFGSAYSSCQVGNDGNIYFTGPNGGNIEVYNPKAKRIIKSIPSRAISNGWNGTSFMNGYIYQVPYNTTTVRMICTNPRDKDYQTVYDNTCYHNLGGFTSTTTIRTYGGVLAYNGKIYCAPAGGLAYVYIIDTIKNITYLDDYGLNIPANVSGAQPYIGSVFGSDGKIYMMPSANLDFMVIDPETETAIRTNYGINITSLTLHSMGISYRNKIYVTPAQADHFIVIDTDTQTATTTDFGLGLVSTTNYKLSGGIVAPDGKVYFTPYSYDKVIILDPETETVTETDYGLDLSATNKYRGGYITQDNRLVFFSRNANNYLVIDLDNQVASFETFGHTFSSVAVKFEGAAHGQNGKLYACPSQYGSIIEVDTKSNTTNVIDGFSASTSVNVKWAGAVSDWNGTVYMLPGRYGNTLRIKPKYNTGENKQLFLNNMMNKF